MYVCMYVCMYVYIYIYICMYVCIYIYIDKRLSICICISVRAHGCILRLINSTLLAFQGYNPRLHPSPVSADSQSNVKPCVV